MSFLINPEILKFQRSGLNSKHTSSQPPLKTEIEGIQEIKTHNCAGELSTKANNVSTSFSSFINDFVNPVPDTLSQEWNNVKEVAHIPSRPRNTNSNGFRGDIRGYRADIESTFVCDDINCRLVGDNATVSPNEIMVKSWKLKNVGTKTIPPQSYIKFESFWCDNTRIGEMLKQNNFGDVLVARKMVFTYDHIKKGSEFQVSMVAKAPMCCGSYKLKFRLMSSKNKKPFGEILTFDFNVESFTYALEINNYNSSSFAPVADIR